MLTFGTSCCQALWVRLPSHTALWKVLESSGRRDGHRSTPTGGFISSSFDRYPRASSSNSSRFSFGQALCHSNLNVYPFEKASYKNVYTQNKGQVFSLVRAPFCLVEPGLCLKAGSSPLCPLLLSPSLSRNLTRLRQTEPHPEPLVCS